MVMVLAPLKKIKPKSEGKVSKSERRREGRSRKESN